MKQEYRIRLAKEPFTFSSAHFITFNGNTCEPLHGHNYRMVAELVGPLDENRYVADFVATQKQLATIIEKLDHQVLLPTKHPKIQVQEVGDEVIAAFEDKRWVFPAEDCQLLPITNTTAEELACWIGERFLEAFHEVFSQQGFTELIIEVDECDGQIGICRFSDP